MLKIDVAAVHDTRTVRRIGMAMLAVGLIIRWMMAYRIPGYAPDVGTFKAWAGLLASGGFGGVYQSGTFTDYPPGYMYVLYMLGELRSALGIAWDSPQCLLLIKSPAILADLLVAWLFLRSAEERSWSPYASLGLAALFILNPAVLLNSAGWGQVDSFFMLWILLFLRFAEREQWNRASVIYAIAVLMKPQALLLAPMLLFMWIGRRSLRTGMTSCISAAAAFIVLILPFALHQKPGWIFELYFSTLSSYPYATLNAYNLMALLGGNFAPQTGQLSPTFGLTFQILGIVLMIMLYVYCTYVYFKGGQESGKRALLGFMIMAGVFTFMGKMHERYLFYALPLALLSYIQTKDRRLLLLYLGFSLTHYINVEQVLRNSYQSIYFTPARDPVLVVTSLANVALMIYSLFLAGDLLLKKRRKASDAIVNPAPVSSKKHLLLLGVLMLAYSALALYHLGSRQSPVTYWKPSDAGVSVIVDLGEKRAVQKVNTFAGKGDGSFTIALSDDGFNWRNPVTEQIDVYKGYSWQSQIVTDLARYMKLTVEKPGFTLYELALFGPESASPLPVSVWKDDGSATSIGTNSPSALFDEQAIAPAAPSYMNGTYFDEIYYVRTALEHMNHEEPFESTHPPLGKLFIALGIWLFGLNPFGWRIVGTCFGIGMIPIMYLFGKRLFGRPEYGLIAAFLFTFDSLHFVQTRIATIDVYGVFFILLMFYYMYRFTTADFFADPFGRCLRILALSGLFFGLGSASKWIVLYGGLGLALAFFIKMGVAFKQYLEAKRQLNTSAIQERYRLMADVFPRRAVLTLGWCLLWFVLIPGTLYVLSYIPFMEVPGPGHGFMDVAKYQQSMLNYHEALKAVHPFSSSWWQWPQMIKPVWYYAGAGLPIGKISSIAAIGNPLVWWPGFIAILMVTYSAVKLRKWNLAFLTIAYFSQYIPWMLVPRLTFLYHYFAMVPFSVLALTYYCKELLERKSGGKAYVLTYMTAVLLLFILFYPVLSGMVIDRSYAEHALRWFPQWIFF